jgi:hypothetical protein
MFGYRISTTVLKDFCRSGRGIDLFLRLPGAMRTYRDFRVIEVNRKTALLQAPDGSRLTIARNRILDPQRLSRANADAAAEESENVRGNDIVEALGSGGCVGGIVALLVAVLLAGVRRWRRPGHRGAKGSSATHRS